MINVKHAVQETSVAWRMTDSVTDAVCNSTIRRAMVDIIQQNDCKMNSAYTFMLQSYRRVV